ncbi:molybdenum cofactor guanylyltransferase, partial [Bacillus altitudinis]|nr:molybdenum cofactor guanylyltransferase [Bacillus altitudinis]
QKLHVQVVPADELNVAPNEFHNINKRSDLPENGMI